MITPTKQTRSESTASSGLQRNYQEVVEFLNAHWPKSRTEKNLAAFTQLDKALGTPSESFKKIVMTGTNGKSLTAHFTTRLLQQEGFKVGVLSAPHILTYNERFAINDEPIQNKLFTELANEVINTAALHSLAIDTVDIILMVSFLYFKQSSADVAILELFDNIEFHPLSIYSPNIMAITRLTDDTNNDVTYPSKTIDALLKFVSKETVVISADQSKTHLQIMHEKTDLCGAKWAMPIRKLAQLPYPFEQLHGRCAALAERIAQLYIELFADITKIEAATSLLAKEKGLRGRPTLEAKRQSELNPKKTVEQFWKETISQLPARFQLLDKEKPTILLDNASNIDALENVFLGIRLLHYQRPFKGLAIIFGCNKNSMNVEEFLKNLRYFTKKNSAQVIFYPLPNNVVPGVQDVSWNVEQITNSVKALKIKAKACTNFAESFEAAKASVDERQGLIVLTGSQSIVTEYWLHKGIKKL